MINNANEMVATGWRRQSPMPSLPEANATVSVKKGLGFWRKMLAFSGPGYMVAVGYMDPGNWATDLAGGSRFGYTLLSVIMISNLMAILLQSLALRLGIVRRDAIWRRRAATITRRRFHSCCGFCAN